MTNSLQGGASSSPSLSIATTSSTINGTSSTNSRTCSFDTTQLAVMAVSSSSNSDGSSISNSKSNNNSKSHATSTSTKTTFVVSLAISVTVTLLSAAAIAWFRSNNDRKRNAQSGHSDFGKNTTENHLADEEILDTSNATGKVDAVVDDESLVQLPHGIEFLECAELVRRMRQLSTDQQLLAYGLYKQVKCGNAPPTNRSSSVIWSALNLNSMEQHVKWKAWDRWRDTDRDKAMQQYNQFVQQWLIDSTRDGFESDEISSNDNDNGTNTYGGVSSNAFAPRVSRPMLVEDENDDEDWNHSASVEGTGGDGPSETRLHKQLLTAASKNDLATLQRILDHQPGSSTGSPSNGLVNRADSSGQTALHLASDRGSYDCVEYLLQHHQANVHARDTDGISVLQAAVIAGHINICRLLLQHGANPDQPDHDGDTPRSCADDDGSAGLQRLFEDY